jgi:hypothetical protein
MFVYEERGLVIKRQYAKEYALEFEKLLNYMVERRMKTAVISVASAWYTAWVNAGQPDLDRLDNKEVSEALQKEFLEIEKILQTGKIIGRHDPE